MSKIKDLLKKTPLRPLWWKFCKIPPMKKIRKYRNRKAKDKLLFKTLPAVYDAHKNEPVDEGKVLFVEERFGEISNSFQVIYDELKNHYDFDIHVHFLGNTVVSKEENIARRKRMLEDAATAGCIFLNDASETISCIDKRPETKVFQLWHACGAFKKFGMSTADLIFGLNRQQQERHPTYRNLSCVTVSSPEIVWAYAEAMSLQGQEEIVQPLGISRTDLFFREDTIRKAYEHLYEQFPAARGKKVILYAPTFRGRVVSARAPEGFDLRTFYRDLGDGYVVVTKHHPFIHNLPEIPEDLEGIFAYDATNSMSIEDLLCVSDFCISDYSSLIFEYSLFERPMLFYAYDLEEYFDWRGFYYPYEELTPGPICRTNEEMTDYILHARERFDRQRVIDFRNKFMSACDGHATERILEAAFGRETLEKRRKK